MNSKASHGRALLVLVVAAVCLALTSSLGAQVKTSTSKTKQGATVTTKVERGEVVYVSGNDVLIKMEDGTIRHFGNVPESFKATVDGKQVGVHDLKAGMKLQRTVTTTNVSKLITTVVTVTGKVWQVTPPNSLILTMDDGKNQRFKIPKNQKFKINGEMVDAWGLKKGMTLSATKIVEEPVNEISQRRSVTGSSPPPPPTPPPADVPILVAVEAPPPAPVAETPAVLPKTGSELPLIGLLGLLSLASSIGLRTARKRS